jgi:ubiquinone/menaquinone biosynthesis C-methylase UbiE
MTDAQPTIKSFDRVAEVYDETRGLPDDVSDRIGDRLSELLRRVAIRPRLLEVGIGTGRMAVPLAARGVRVTGIDVSPAMLARLREKRRDIDVMLAEASRPPVREGAFDAALFVHILHLVPDAATTIAATLSLVRAGGVVIEGHDDHTNSMRERADRIVQAAIAEALSIADEARGTDAYVRSGRLLEEMLRARGAGIERVMLASWQTTTTARKMLARLERRDFSSSWRIPDDRIADVVGLAAPRLEALAGGLDAPIEFRREFSAMAGFLPA